MPSLTSSKTVGWVLIAGGVVLIFVGFKKVKS